MSTILTEPTVESAAEKNSRRPTRYSLSLPTRVDVRVDNKFSWNEVTRMEDVSALGAGFNLKRPVKRGRLILVSAPMPRQLRCYDFLEPQYRVWSLVRKCVPISEEPGAASYAVGVAFVGKHPPDSFSRNPARLYDLAEREEGGLWQLVEASRNPDESGMPAYARRHSRFAIPETLVIELLDENGDVAASEVTVTENVSLGGAAVFTSFNIEVGSFVRVQSDRLNTSIISVVRGKRVGEDGIVRLHVEFIDHMFPLEGIE
jgi:hypothetical protein